MSKQIDYVEFWTKVSISRNCLIKINEARVVCRNIYSVAKIHHSVEHNFCSKISAKIGVSFV